MAILIALAAFLGQDWPTVRGGAERTGAVEGSLPPGKPLRIWVRHFNRYLASLLAFEKIASKQGDGEAAKSAKSMAEETTRALLEWWRRAAGKSELRVIRNITEWDEFIVKGEEEFFFKVIPHNHKLALFYELTPEVAALVKAAAPEAVAKLWKQFEELCATWWLVGEEHQVHFGENFVDLPDLARDAFKAYAWLEVAPGEALRRRVDIPFCRADVYHVLKLAIACDAR